MNLQVSGIYCIENIKNNKKYIGRSQNIRNRWYTHRSSLKRGDDSVLLQQAWNEFGEGNFKLWIIEECDKSQLYEKEIYYIEEFQTRNINYGYNFTKGGSGTNGLIHTDETKKKISESETGKIISNAIRLKMSTAGKNRKSSESTKSKISKSLMSNKRRLGTHQSEKYKSKLSVDLQGVKRKYDGTSKYVGVYLVKKKYWIARIVIKTNKIHIGTFATEIEAAMAYNEVALDFLGWKARLNTIFKEEIEKLWESE